MKNAAAQQKTTTDDKPDPAAVKSAQEKFVGAAATMGLQLAVAVLLPLLIGIFIDKRADSQPAATMVGLFIGLLLGAATVWQTIRNLGNK